MQIRALTKTQEACQEAPHFDQTAPLEVLTPREREISILVAKGFSNKEVAQFLDISHWTVATQLKATFLKLGLGGRCKLAYVLRRLL